MVVNQGEFLEVSRALRVQEWRELEKGCDGICDEICDEICNE